MKFRIAYFVLFTVVFFCSAPLFSEEFSEEQSDVLTIVTIEDTLPYSFSLPDGTLSGLYVEFWKLWSETNNIPIRFVLVPFEEGLQLVRQKNTLHTGLISNEQREQWADFSLPIHNVQTGIIYNRSINKDTKLRELSDIKVATYRSSYQEHYIRKNYPDIELSTFANFDEASNQLLNNEVQAVIIELPSALAQLAQRGLIGVFTISEEVIISNNVFSLIAKGQPQLLAKINAGIENIPVNKIIELEKKWLPTLKPFFSNNSSLASLTLAERKWLQQNSSLSLGIASGLYPYEFINDNGDFSGIAADYIEYINNSLSLTIDVDKSYSWEESLAAIKTNDIDVISTIIRTPEREKSMLFTEPYISEPTVLVSRKNGFNTSSLERLKGRTIGIPATNAILEFVATDYPEIIIVPVDSTIDGLKKLHQGEFDAFIGSIAVINYNINKEQLSNLIITGFSAYKLEISMAVRTELEPLVGILNKVFLNISEKEKAAIANNWLSIQVKTGTELSTIILWVLPIMSFLILTILMFFRMNRRLKIEIDGREKSEKTQKILVSQLHQSQKMEALGKLTGGIAHDFNNMLGIILGYSELLKRKLLNEKQLSAYVEHISHAGERGANITKKLLSFTRKQHTQATQVDINSLLRHQHDILQKTLTVRIKITLKLSENIWPIWLELSDLEDAILNMSINAMHAMSDYLPTGELVFKTENIVVTEDYAEELSLVAGNYVKLCIIDNGCGMSKEISKKIFDPFFSTKGHNGTGLGLSQVFGFVQRSSGSIIVNPLLDQGTHFSLYFPKYIAQPEEDSVQFKSRVEKLEGTETILIVDDELTLCQLAGNFLQTEGYNILVAESGKSALMVLENEHVDLVLTDVIMPEMDGYQLAVEITKSYPEMKIKLVSGFTDEKNNSFVGDDLQRGLLRKPYNRIELLEGVRTLLDS
ncbi:MAG: signal transduction histidine kinase/CheY-like chemotaxis protein [Enterobacterales bacterium]|jgi:signal transduction histidine kinase/CheY-like chemotaxis protein